MEELSPAKVPTKEAASIEEPTEEAPLTEEPTDEMAPMEEPTEEPTAPKAPTSKPSGESDITPVQCEDKGKGEVPHSDYPGWMQVLHLAQSATSAREIPLPPGELRQRYHSWSVGGRRAQHQRAKEHRQAKQEIWF